MAVRELGRLGLATTDLINARALLQGSRKTRELLHTCPDDRLLVVQIYGTVPEEMGRDSLCLPLFLLPPLAFTVC
jgi:tRNA-dihydrouridine synthase